MDDRPIPVPLATDAASGGDEPAARGRHAASGVGHSEPGAESATVRGLRGLLLALLALGSLGLGAELLLLEHWEEPRQWIPLVGLGATLLLTLGLVLRPRPRSLRIFRLVMVALVVAGALGTLFHLQSNAALEREIDPEVGGLALVVRSFLGGTPALAPGALAQLGLLGLVATFRHPLDRR